MYPKTSSRSGSILVKHEQQPKPALRCYLMILILFMLLLLLLLIFAANTFVSFFPPSYLNSLRQSSVIPSTKKLIIRSIICIFFFLLFIHGSLVFTERTRSNGTVGFCRSLIDGTANVAALGRKEQDGSHVGVLCCDRSHNRTDICYMKGDVRTGRDRRDKLFSIFLYNSGQKHLLKEKIRPYTRKWETSVMSTIDELTLVPVTKHGPTSDNDIMKCDVHHKVRGVVLSTGGYTGNMYHDFNDGLIPLYLTTERFNGEVVLLVLEYRSWWMSRYESVVNKISKYEIVDLSVDNRVHCFPEMIVGMKIHGELCIDPHLMPNGKGMQNFQDLLYESFGTSTTPTQAVSTQLRLPLQALPRRKRPKLTMFIREETRVLLDLQKVIQICKTIGFQVKLIAPKPETPLSEIHSDISTSDVMVAVNGAAMTHFLFARPGSVMIQIVPLGLDKAADDFCGQPARKLGLEYVEYRIAPSESSLSKEYGPNHPVISDPSSINSKGWQETKRIYLGHQNITLDVKRFGNVLARVYETLIG